MQATYLWQFSDRTQLWWLTLPRVRRVHMKGPMDPPSVIIVRVGSKYTLKMPLIEHNHMIEGVSPNAADNPLAVWILPRRSWRDLHLFGA
jgi:hypothetical protein